MEARLFDTTVTGHIKVNNDVLIEGRLSVPGFVGSEHPLKDFDFVFYFGKDEIPVSLSYLLKPRRVVNPDGTIEVVKPNRALREMFRDMDASGNVELIIEFFRTPRRFDYREVLMEFSNGIQAYGTIPEIVLM